MKKSTNTLLLSGAIALLFSATVYAQTDAVAYNRKAETSPSISAINKSTSVLDEAELKTTHPKLMDNFSKHFPGATGANWSVLNKGHQVSFVISGRKTRAVFTEGDVFSYSITDFKHADLPVSVSQMAKTNFSDYTIFSAQEAKTSQATCYHLVLENASGYITVKISGEEMEEVSRTAKAK